MQFDGTITLGNILTIITMGGAFIVWFFRRDAKLQRISDAVEVIQNWIRLHQECSNKQEEILTELRICVGIIKAQPVRQLRRKGTA